MEPSTRIPYGHFDVAAREMEDFIPQFTELWDRGQFRMRPEDIERLKKYLQRIRKADRAISAIIKNFETLN